MPYDQPYQQQPPGIFGASAQGMFGTGNQPGGQIYQQQMAQQQSGMMAGASATNFATNTLPGLAMAGYMGTTMLAAPLMEYGAKTAGVRTAGKILGMADPFNLAMQGGMKAFGGGRAVGGAMARGLGMTAVRGMAGGALSTAGTALAGTAGVAAGGAVAAGILGTAAAGYYGAKATIGQVYGGATDVMQGQTLTQQMGASAGLGGNATAGQGRQMSQMMKGMGKDMGMDPQELGKIAKELNSERVFQTVSGMKEFQSKFKEVMGAVKEISKLTQSTIDEAAKTFTDLKRQGFYTTADIKAAAVKQDAREASSGLSSGQMSAVGSAGAQMGRQYGMRGRVGSEAATSGVAALAGGLRRGNVSEELVGEMGGVEQAAMRLTSRKMGFLSSPRGRAMIAMSMKDDGGVDPMKMAAMMQSGVTTETIVSGARSRGLGVLGKAGMREAKEAAMPYASVMMVQMAQSQARQLGWSTDKKGTLGMLGTMGVTKDEGALMLQEIGAMPQQLAAEAQAQQLQRSAALFEERKKGTTVGQMKGKLSRGFSDPLRQMGSKYYSGISENIAGAQQKWSGTGVVRTGDSDFMDMVGDAADGGGHSPGSIDMSLTGKGGRWGGGMSSRDVLRENMAFSATGGDVDLGAGGLGGLGYEGSEAVLTPGDLVRFGKGVITDGFNPERKSSVKTSEPEMTATQKRQERVHGKSKAYTGGKRDNLQRFLDGKGSGLGNLTGGLMGRQSGRGQVEDEVSTLMQTGKYAGQRQDITTYVLGKKMGGDESETYDDYKKRSGRSTESMEAHEQARADTAQTLKAIGEDTDIDTSGMLKGYDTNALAGLTLKEGRSKLQASASDTFKLAQDKGRWGVVGQAVGGGIARALGGSKAGLAFGLITNGPSDAGHAQLATAMADDDSVRSDVFKYVKALEDDDSGEVNRLKVKLKDNDKVGTQAGGILDNLDMMAQEGGDDWTGFLDSMNDEQGTKHISMAVGAKETEQKFKAQGSNITSRLKRDALTKGMNPAQRRAFENFAKTTSFGDAGDREARTKAHSDLFAQYDLTDAEDLQQIGDIAGGQVHTEGVKIQQLMSGEGEGYTAMLNEVEAGLERELTPAERKSLESGSSEDRQIAATKLLADGGQLESTKEGSTGGQSQASIGDAFVQFAEVMPEFGMIVERIIAANPNMYNDVLPKEEDG